MSAQPTKLEPALAALPAAHRRAVAEAIGAGDEAPAAIAATLLDESRLEALVGGLSDEAQAAATELAFAAIDLWSPPSAPRASRAAVEELERRGLALCFETSWSLGYIAPEDLLPALRRICARAHAARIPDAPAPARTLATSERLLDDVAAVGATIAHGGIQVKADGELYAKARPKLAAPLAAPIEPALELGEKRVDLALTVLRELGALRVVTDDLPGRNTRRELRLMRDLPALLDRPFEERMRLGDAIVRTASDLPMIEPLLDELAGRRVALEAVGAAVTALCAQACKHLPAAASATPAEIGLGAAHLRWLSARATLGVDADGRLATVCLAAQPPPDFDHEPCVAQADFELVALRPPLPHERAALLLLAEPVPGREHVVRVTRERIESATRVLGERDPDAILGRLRALAGSLPQNVERSVADWVRRVPPRARLRSAVVLDLGDAEHSERVVAELGGLLAERLAPHLLAVPADELAGVASAVRRAGVALEPGLDRVSGAWHDRAGDPDRDDSAAWRPSSGIDERLAPPPGTLVSGLEQAPATVSPVLARAQEALDRLGIDLDLLTVPQVDDEDYDELEPGDVVLDAYEMGEIVELSYAAAGGTLVERVTIEDVDGARFLVEDTDTGTRRWRWLKGVRSARLIEG